MADFNDRFPAEPSTASQLITGLKNGAESTWDQAKWAASGANDAQPPMYTGGSSYPLQAQDLLKHAAAASREEGTEASDNPTLREQDRNDATSAAFKAGNYDSNGTYTGGKESEHPLIVSISKQLDKHRKNVEMLEALHDFAKKMHKLNSGAKAP